MKEVRKIEKWIVSILMLFVAVIILAGALLPYLQIDFTGVLKVVEGINETVAKIFYDITEFLGNERGKLTFTAWTLLKVTMRKSVETQVLEAAVTALKSIRLIILVPYVLVVLSIIFLFFRRTWSYIITAVLSAGGLALAFLSIVVVIPKKLYYSIPEEIRRAGDLLDIFDEGVLRSFVRKGLGISWWITVIGCGLLLILSIIGIVLCVKKGKAASATHGICCGFGVLSGVGIPLSTGQEILIGRDTTRCNYIAQDAGIENIHCRIRYIGNNSYEVTNYSTSGVLINGKRIVSGNGVNVQAGSSVLLASQYKVDLL